MRKFCIEAASFRSSVACQTRNWQLITGNSLLALFLIFLPWVSCADSLIIFTGADAAAVIGTALVKAGAGNEVKVHMNGIGDQDAVSTASAPISAEVDSLNVDKDHGSWQATLLFKADNRNLAPVNVSGNYDEIMQVPVLRRQVRSGEVITAEDIDLSKLPVRNVRKNTVTDSRQLIGKSPKRVISQGRPIRQEEIANPAILLKGAHITMIYKTRNLEITTLGEALESGAKGDVIRVKNLSSRQVIDGIVETSGRVHVTSPETNSAEAM